MSNKYTVEQVIEMMKKGQYINIAVQEYHVGGNRNSYLNSHDDLYDNMMENIDDLEFLVDKVGILRDKCGYNGSSTLQEFLDVLNNHDESDIDGLVDGIDWETENDEKIEFGEDDEDLEDTEYILEMTLDEIEEKFPEIHKSIIELLDGLEDDDLDAWSDGSVVFDCEYPDDDINEAQMESLAYWTVYFEPDYEKADIATLVGLTPFKYEDTFYLALGGCGMDLSPKLDAYIALTHGVIPSDSQFFRQKDYFEYVVGKQVAEMVEKKCKRESEHIIVSFNVPVEIKIQEPKSA